MPDVRNYQPPRKPVPFRAYGGRQLERIEPLKRLDAERRFAMGVVAKVLPFRVNQYVIDQLIDWERVPGDPLFQLTFPQPGMLAPHHFERIAALVRAGAGPEAVRHAARAVQQELNPHPAEQRTLNVPRLGGAPLQGMQHKYRETVLFFPSQGQTCHSYCTFCFRWPQFVGDEELRIFSREVQQLQAYLRVHPEVTDLLITGGDPMVMKTRHFEAYLRPLVEPAFEHVQNIRIGTKALTYWPYRFISDPDADELLRLFESLVEAGKHVALMAHFNHPREMGTPVAREAIRRVLATGAVIRTQAPLLAHINDAPQIWADMWREQVRLGMVPYYLFVARDTGAQCYFEVPLAEAWAIYRDAVQAVSGLARTVRGPSMSAGPGKVEVQGVAQVEGEKVFVLRFLQGRNPEWVQRPFFARYDGRATWLNQLQPAFGQKSFFYEEEYRAMLAAAGGSP